MSWRGLTHLAASNRLMWHQPSILQGGCGCRIDLPIWHRGPIRSWRTAHAVVWPVWHRLLSG